MSDALLKSALALPTAERILLAEQLWDSIANDAQRLPLTPAQQAELNRRLERIESTGLTGDDWPTVRARITSRGRDNKSS